MSEPEDTTAKRATQERRAASRRRRRLAALGDTTSERSADDRDSGWSERDATGTTARDDELRREVPPHHG